MSDRTLNALHVIAFSVISLLLTFAAAASPDYPPYWILSGIAIGIATLIAALRPFRRTYQPTYKYRERKPPVPLQF